MSGVAQESLSVETLYTDYHSWLHCILQRRLGSRDDAADLAHDDDPPERHLEVEVLEVARHVPTQLAVALCTSDPVSDLPSTESEVAR